MASTSSVLSFFVVLLAAYCYAVPIGTGFQFTTVYPEQYSNQHIVERESVPMVSSVEETTVDSEVHVRQTYNDNSNISTYTTETPFTWEHENEERTVAEEVTSSSPSFEATSVMSKRSAENDFAGAVTSEHENEERSLAEEVTSSSPSFEATSVMSKRSDENNLPNAVAGETPYLVNADDRKKRTETVNMFQTTGINGTSEGSKVVRNFESDFATVESSTEFNNRAIRLTQGEPIDLEMTTIVEPSSSFESLAQSTGLLNARNLVQSQIRESEGSHEEDNTTSNSDN